MSRLLSAHTHEEVSDAELVDTLRVHRGDHSEEENNAMRELMDRLKPDIDAVLRFTNIGAHDFDELEQQVFILVLRKIHTLRDPETLHAWVKRIARRKALDHAMRRRGTHDVQLHLGDEQDQGNAWEPTDDKEDRPLEQVLQGERERLLLSSLEAMPEVLRLRLRQFYLRGMSLQDIVDEGDGESPLPIGTVKRQLHDARLQLKTTLSRQIESE